jgi:hypothetical protein
MPRKLLLRLLFLTLIVGGVFFWQRSKVPRDLKLLLDVSAARPSEITGFEVLVRRSGAALARHEVTFGAAHAPAKFELTLHLVPGPADVETTLVYGGKPARRVQTEMDLSAEHDNLLRIE